jgi:hypothetical protein
VLAAPAGRAAKRLAELAGHDAATIHRLLQLRPGGDHGADSRHRGAFLVGTPVGSRSLPRRCMADEGSTEGLTGTRGERSPWTLREDRYHSDPLAGGRIVWLVLGGTTVAAVLFAVKSIRALRAGAGRWAF